MAVLSSPELTMTSSSRATSTLGYCGYSLSVPVKICVRVSLTNRWYAMGIPLSYVKRAHLVRPVLRYIGECYIIAMRVEYRDFGVEIMSVFSVFH